MQYKSKTISLADDVWAALERLKKEFGSYNKALKAKLVEKPKKEKQKS